MSDAALPTPNVTIDTPEPVAPKKNKHALLPVLIVLFVISYGLMCTLVVEQGSTIDAQRFLIRQLLGDSTQLSALKGRATQKKQADPKTQGNVPAQPNAQVPAQQAPSAQSTPRDNGKGARKSGKLQRPAPQKPPRDASEMADERRNLISI